MGFDLTLEIAKGSLWWDDFLAHLPARGRPKDGMIQCDRCRTTNPAGAQFCMKCGAPLVAPSVPARQRQAPNNQRAIWIAVGAVCLLLVGLGLGMSGVLRKLSTAPKPGVLTSAADAPAPDLLKIEAKPQDGVTRRVQTGMPNDIRLWLEHLERIEKRRRDLALRQIGSFTVTMATLQISGAMDVLKDLMEDPTQMAPEDPAPSTADKVHAQVEDARGAWRAIRDEFTSIPPPAECMPIRDQYEIALRETSGMMIDLLSALDRAMSSDNVEDKQKIVSELYAMKGTSASIDKAGQATDGLLADICRKYETPKWFGIAGDIGGGGMTAMPGF